MVDGPDGSSSSGDNNAILRLPVKLPAFWKSDVRLWFCQLDAVFQAYGIALEKTKYFHVVPALEGEVLSQVSDLILNVPENQPYTTLKNRLISLYAESEQSRLQKLLGNLSLGDRRPSHLLREMKTLIGDQVAADSTLLKQLWIRRLPKHTQAILAVSAEDDVDKMAALADKIIEVTHVNEINSVSLSTSDRSYNDFKQQIDELTKVINSLKSDRSRSRSASHNNTDNKFRSRSKTPKSNDKNLCWYHNRFGDKATKCRDGCSYNVSPKN